MRKTINNFILTFSIFSVFSVAILFLFCVSVSAQNKIIIRVSAETVVENDRIELGKIAQISGEAAKIERLKSISLGYAPNVGLTREILRGQIVLALNAAGFVENEILLDAPIKILVRRASQEITNNQIRQAVEKSVLSQFPVDKISAQIVRFDAPDKILVPIGSFEIRVTSANVQNLFATFSLPIEIRVDNKVVRRLAINAEIEAFAEILVAAKDLAANTKVSESDVRIEKRRLEKPITNYLCETKNLRGAVLLKNVSSGTEITSNIIISSYVVKIGDSVQIEAQSGALKIIIKGEARASGKIGDRISVKNSQSGAILQAEVLDEGLVKINF
jgi:flagella basal body P-ring formation protein FlgA